MARSNHNPKSKHTATIGVTKSRFGPILFYVGRATARNMRSVYFPNKCEQRNLKEMQQS